MQDPVYQCPWHSVIPIRLLLCPITTLPDLSVSVANALWGNRGEQTAQALEANLTSLERKLDDFLASFDEVERQKAESLKVAKGGMSAVSHDKGAV